MHKIFGNRENAKYLDRVGSYVVPVKDGYVGVVRTPKGYFLIGGGIEGKENPKAAIMRECLEETGYTVSLGELICTAEAYVKHSELGYFHPMQSYYTGVLEQKVQEPIESDHIFEWVKYEKLKGNMFSQMQNWAIEQIINSDNI